MFNLLVTTIEVLTKTDCIYSLCSLKFSDFTFIKFSCTYSAAFIICIVRITQKQKSMNNQHKEEMFISFATDST